MFREKLLLSPILRVLFYWLRGKPVLLVVAGSKKA